MAIFGTDDYYFTHKLKSDLLKWTVAFQCFLFALLISPVLLLITVVTLICRLLVTFHLNLVHDGKFTLCAPSDAAFAVESHANTMTINGFLYVKGQTDIYKLREKSLRNFIGYETQDGRQPYQKFTWKLLRMYGFYTWETSNDSFDIRDHVKLCPGVDYTSVYSEEQVLEAAEKLLDDVLNSKQPKWELLYVPKVKMCKTGNDNEESLYYAIIFKAQHAYVDGISAMQLLRKGFCDELAQLTIDPVNLPIPKVSTLELIGLYIQTFFTAPYSYYKMISTTPKSVFQNIVTNTGPKYLACSKRKIISLESIKLIRNKFKCSTTALFNSAITGALRRAAERKKLPIPDNLDFGFTVAVLPYPNEDPQNRFTIKLLQSPVSISDPVKRLSKLNLEMASVTPSEVLALYSLGKLVGILPAMFISLVYTTARFGCAVTNIPGFKERPCINGDVVEEFYGCPPIRNGIGFAVGVCSHNGNIRTLWTIEKSIVISSKEDANDLVSGFEKEIAHLNSISNENAN